MESLNLFIEEIKSQPWQFNVGFLTIIPSYVFTIRVLYGKKVGLKKKIDKAQKKETWRRLLFILVMRINLEETDQEEFMVIWENTIPLSIHML